MKKQRLQEGSTSFLPEVIKQQPTAKRIRILPLKPVNKVKLIVRKVA